MLKKDAENAPNRFKQLEKALERSNLPKIVLDDLTTNLTDCRNSLQKIFKPKFKGKILFN